MLGDYGFESGTLATSASHGRYSGSQATMSSDAYEGAYSVKVAGAGYLQQLLTVEARRYSISFVCKGGNSFNFGINYPVGGWFSTDVACGASWTPVTLEFTMPSQGATNISLWKRDGGPDIYFDNVVIMPK